MDMFLDSTLDLLYDGLIELQQAYDSYVYETERDGFTPISFDEWLDCIL